MSKNRALAQALSVVGALTLACILTLLNEQDALRLHRPVAEPERNAWMLSFPRSGSHVLRAIIENVTGCTTRSVYQREAYPMLSNTAVQHSAPKIAWLKLHSAEARTNWSPSQLLLVLRDPYEAIASDLRLEVPGVRELRAIFSAVPALTRILDFYDAFPGPKAVLYYEEMQLGVGLSGLWSALSTGPLSCGQPRQMSTEPTRQSVLELVSQPVIGTSERGGPISMHNFEYYRSRKTLQLSWLPFPERHTQLLGRYNSVRFVTVAQRATSTMLLCVFVIVLIHKLVAECRRWCSKM